MSIGLGNGRAFNDNEVSLLKRRTMCRTNTFTYKDNMIRMDIPVSVCRVMHDLINKLASNFKFKNWKTNIKNTFQEGKIFFLQ